MNPFKLFFKPRGLGRSFAKHMPDANGRSLHNVLVDLEDGKNLTSDEVLDHWRRFISDLSTNCFSAAEGKLLIASRFGVIDPYYAKLFLPDVFRALYYYGIEDLGELKRFIKSVSSDRKSNWCKLTKASRSYLRELSVQDSIIIEAFREMYELEENEWRIIEDDVDDIPKILMK